LLTVIPCPGCGVPAEVTERFSLPGTEGPVGHVALSCAAGHHFRMAVDGLSAPAQEQLAALPPMEASRVGAGMRALWRPDGDEAPGAPPGTTVWR